MKLRENHLYTNGKTAVIINLVDDYGYWEMEADIVYSPLMRASDYCCTETQFRKRYPTKVDRVVIEVEG